MAIKKFNYIGKRLTATEFEEYVKNKFFGFLPANKLILHHTVHPTLEQWNGEQTLLNIKNYYQNDKGWNRGPHLFIAPDGIWLFTDMRKDGIHANSGNWRSIGIEMVGNYDNKLPSGKVWELTKAVIKILKERLNISLEQIKFHNDYSSKSCPGNAITKEWVYNEVYDFTFFKDGELIKTNKNPKIYYIHDRIKYPVPNPTTLHFFWQNRQVKILSTEKVNSIKTGGTLPPVDNHIAHLG